MEHIAIICIQQLIEVTNPFLQRVKSNWKNASGPIRLESIQPKLAT